MSTQMVDNPEYHFWSRFKPGAFCTRSVTDAKEDPHRRVFQSGTLKSLSSEKAVVEWVFAQQVYDRELANQPRVEEIPAKISAEWAEYLYEPDEKLGEGEEVLNVLGRELRTRWIEAKLDIQFGYIFTKSWISDEIPGGIVREEDRGVEDGPPDIIEELMAYGLGEEAGTGASRSPRSGRNI